MAADENVSPELAQKLLDIILTHAETGTGTYVKPVRKGDAQGGYMSPYRYEFDGWEIGWIHGASGEEEAVGATLEEAVEAWWNIGIDPPETPA